MGLSVVDELVEIFRQIKSQALFQTWVKEIRAHREYRQAEMKNDDTLRPENPESRVVSIIDPRALSTKVVSRARPIVIGLSIISSRDRIFKEISVSTVNDI